MAVAVTRPRPALRAGRVLLTGVAAVFYVLGWTAGVLWLALSWPVLAAVVGWRDATARRGGS